ncbi:hypothetical protein DFH28DRAFT_1130564 [Melampsora americana]|nr:hypothetical protein DFH28DRAFT_1130564 [Melampsora americana]
MSSNQQRSTRSGRVTRKNPNPLPESSSQTLPSRKKRQRPNEPCNQASTDQTVNHIPPTPSATQQTTSGSTKYPDLSYITLQNYHQFKTQWPLNRIQEQLKEQSSSNHQLSAAVLAEAQAVFVALEHSLHMIAMISHVKLDTLKRALGLLGGTHGDNSWHRWLSFALAANDIPMPARGDPAASDLLSVQNQTNSKTYRGLKDDELAVFTAEVFYALGGYPDYSSISITDEVDVFGDSSTLVPEVPKLSPADENRYRPLYEKLVDLKKVAKDRELNTPGSSACKEEKRSLQCFKKIALQLARDHQLLGMDYYIIACSNSNTGEGWCREYTSRDEIARWVGSKAQMQHIFPLYCQHGSTIEAIKANAAANDPSAKNKKSKNQSDLDKAELVGLLNQLLVDVLGDTNKVFPKIANPIEALKARKIPVIIERAVDSTVTPEEFEKGFTVQTSVQASNTPQATQTTSGAAKANPEDCGGETQAVGSNAEASDSPVGGSTQGAATGTQTASSKPLLDHFTTSVPINT